MYEEFLILEIILQINSNILIPQFLSMIIAALQRMYITAWAANDLKEVVSSLKKLFNKVIKKFINTHLVCYIMLVFIHNDS